MKEPEKNPLDNLIRKNFLVVNAYTATNLIRNNLIEQQAVVICDELERPLGILTPSDVLKRPHNLVIDCLVPKTPVSYDLTLTQVMEMMLAEKEDVLPVFKSHELIGLIYKDDIVESIRQQQSELEAEIANTAKILKKITWIQSHKVRQPVASILGLIQLIDESSLTDQNKEIISMLHKTASEFDKIINTIVTNANSGIGH